MMKNTIVGCLFMLTFLQACNKDEVLIPTCENCNFTCLSMNEPDVITNECKENWECEFKVTPLSKVELNENLGRVIGDKNVFQMINQTEGSPAIADDEYTDVLVFELEESQQSFSADDNELKDMKVHFRRFCFCADVEFISITEGCLQGEKQSDGSWFVEGNLLVPYSFGNVDVKLEAQFTN